jgi:P-type Ca2+ transporter type 2C
MHHQSAKETESTFKTDLNKGLSGAEAQKRLLQYGYNQITEKKDKNSFAIFINQFKSPIVFLLLFAAGMSFFFKEWLDGIAILAVLFINALIGFFMEYQAQLSMNALKKLTRTMAKVYRDNHLLEIPSGNLVPGDILFVEAGDIISADARIINPSQLQINESALTGESLPVEKNDSVLEKDVALAERFNMIYKGTHVTRGNAKAIVSGTGMNTELGKIADLVHSADQEATPIEKKLEDFSKKLIWITVILVVVIFIAGVLNGEPIVEMLETSIAMAVAAIPEGLPIVATLALAQGMLKMARHNVIVKKLAAVETLGGTNIICTDKTGTLTQNKIEVSKIITIDFRLSENPTSTRSFDLILKASVLCNTAEIRKQGTELIEIGDPLETALIKFAEKRGNINQIRQDFEKTGEEPFSSETKIMAMLYKHEDKYYVFAKGATEELLRKCSGILKGENVSVLTDEDRKHWIKESEKLASSGLRVIAFAWKETSEKNIPLSKDLVFTGLVGMIDPPRPEVRTAIEECRSAGIKVVMITGDHPATAKNIGLELGLINSAQEEVIHGNNMKDYENLTRAEKEVWKNARIFARVSPKQKLDLVKVLQEDKSVVAMTGDGVNDAPALKKSDIGIAMGLRGTQVAQEVSDMILKDDSFSSIVIAVKQGRIIFENIRKFVIFLLSCNLSEIFLIASSSILNLHFKLFPLQILFINLVTDVLPALALGVSEGNKNVMQHLPRDPEVPIMNRKQWYSLVVYSIIITLFTLAAVFFSHYTIHKTETLDPFLCNNTLFFTLIFCQLLHAFNMSNRKEPFLKSETFRNKYLWYATIICIFIPIMAYAIPVSRKVLDLYEMTMNDWLIVSFFSLGSFLCIRIMKRLNIVL